MRVRCWLEFGGCDALVGALWRLRFVALRRNALSPGACITALHAGGRGVARGCAVARGVMGVRGVRGAAHHLPVLATCTASTK